MDDLGLDRVLRATVAVRRRADRLEERNSVRVLLCRHGVCVLRSSGGVGAGAVVPVVGCNQIHPNKKNKQWQQEEEPPIFGAACKLPTILLPLWAAATRDCRRCGFITIPAIIPVTYQMP